MSALVDQIQQHAVHDGDCWRWIGARQTTRGRTPQMKWQGRVSSVRRFILLDRGVDMQGFMAGTSCGNADCVNPAHVVRKTRAELVVESAAAMDAGARAMRSMRLSQVMRERVAKLSEEIAQAIRDDGRSHRAIAAAYGVSSHTVGAIKRGELWRQHGGNPFFQLMR